MTRTIIILFTAWFLQGILYSQECRQETFTQQLALQDPLFWSVETSSLYSLQTGLVGEGTLVDADPASPEGDFSVDGDPVSGECDPIFVAHRGASYLAPENTLASIRLAWEQGADAAECDVMLTSDHRVILFHDKNTRSLTGENLVVSKTGWKKLSRLTIRLKESNLSRYAQERIPLLSEVLETIPADRMLVIEIKTGREILPFLKQVIDAHWHSGRISFICFDLETILATKRLFPEHPCYYLSSFRPDVIRHFDEILGGGLDGVNVRHKAVNKILVQRCRAQGLEVWCWTVNKPEDARKMKALGVSAITTDRPKWLKEQI